MRSQAALAGPHSWERNWTQPTANDARWPQRVQGNRSPASWNSPIAGPRAPRSCRASPIAATGRGGVRPQQTGRPERLEARVGSPPEAAALVPPPAPPVRLGRLRPPVELGQRLSRVEPRLRHLGLRPLGARAALPPPLGDPIPMSTLVSLNHLAGL